ncbi:MAG: response regulator [Deltaproteobacteria bacterium]|nr:response regulator [Deltaproteobacteria bacterium]MBW2362132.1 response regulator [Deltaproteobacteria bacterium]
MSKKLLLADDSVTIQKVVGISFANEDIELVTVDNGDDAVVRAREELPDVVLADVVMPGKNGYEVCEALRNDPKLAHVPVLLLTGTFEAFDNELAERCGASGHIAKPFEAQTLVDRVLELMSAPPAPRSGPIPSGNGDASTQAIGRIEITPSSAAVEPAGNSSSFDFFDDTLGDEPAQAGAAENLELDTEDSAFGFGVSTPEPAAESPPAPATPVPGIIANDPLAHTQLISEEPEPAAPAADLDIALGLDTATSPSDDTLSGLVTEDSAGPDLLDFVSISDNQLAGESLAQETVLDPQGASGYDVSGSDLGSGQDTSPAAADDLLWGDASSSSMPPVGSTAPEPNELRPLDESPPLAAAIEAESESGDTLEAPAVATLMDESSLEEVAFSEPAPDFAIGEAMPAVEAIEADDFADVADLAPIPENESSPVSTSHDEAALAGITLAGIEPQLREKLHDTLEKIAWESLGAVTEQIVNQAVERIERAAWEVIPEMAETLIREEIRRMKGE